MRTRYTLAKLILSSLLMATPMVSAADSILQPTLQSFDQYTRIQIPVNSGSTFSVMNGNGDSKIILQKVRPESLASLNSLSDGRVSGIAVNKLGLDQSEISLKFRDSGTESFAYMQGNVLVLDLWQQKAEAGASGVVESKKALATKAKKPNVVAVKENKKKPSRSIASVSEAKASTKIVNPLKIDRDVFQKFLLPQPEMIQAKGATIFLPPRAQIDDLWTFSPKKESTDEAKSFEFVRKLYAGGKFGLAIKSVEISRRDYPKSPFNAELDLLEAFSYKKLGEQTKIKEVLDKSDQMLALLGTKNDEEGNPLPYQVQIRSYFGQRAYLEKNWFEALSQLEFVAVHMDPKNADFPFMQFLLADCYIRVNQPRRAERIYRYLIEHHEKHVLAKEAAYRVADILANEKNYKRAVEEGESALESYPEYEKVRSEVVFNIGEGYFWLGKYAQAEKYFKKFISKYSSNTISALAWVRLGEISELARSDINGARECYLKAKNGYPFSSGDLVGTIRLSRIDINTEKDPGFVLKSIKEILKDKAIDSDQRRAAELVMVDYLLMLGYQDDAIQIARKGMSENSGTPYEAYKTAFIKSTFSKWEMLTNEKHFPEALSLYNAEKKWIDLYGPESLKVSSNMYRGLGLYSSSNEMMERYAAEMRNSKGRNIASTMSALDFTKAENSFAKGNYGEALASLPEGNGPKTLFIKAVSEFRLGRKKESFRSAEKALAAFKEENENVDDDSLEQLSEILIERDDSAHDYNNMEKTLAVVSSLQKKESPRVKFAQADALWYQKRHVEAIAAYQEAIKKFPKGERAERAKYNIGMSQIALGKRDDAVKTLTELRAVSKSLWAESAQRELDLIEWETKYSSVLKTLPPSGLGIVN